MRLAQLLSDRMRELNMSQADLARITKLSDAAISKFLSGRLTNPTAETISAFSVALGLKYDEIIDAARASRRVSVPEPLGAASSPADQPVAAFVAA